MNFKDYFLAVPAPGDYYWLAVLTPMVVGAIGFGAVITIRYTRSAVMRRRFRVLRTVSLLAAALLALQLVLRGIGAPVLSYRIVFYVLLVPYLLWLVWWLLGLRSLTHDLVVEREQRRKRGYQKRGRRRHR